MQAAPDRKRFNGAFESYSGTIDWGDGTSTATAGSGNWSHTYNVAGTFEIAITGSGTVDTDGDPGTPPDPCDDDFSATLEVQPELAIDDVEVVEGDDGTAQLQFTAELSAPTDEQVTAPYATVPGSAAGSPPNADFNPVTGQLTFAPGDTSENVVVTVIGDRDVEPDEAFTVEISSAENAIVSDGTGEGTILTDETERAIRIGNATVAEGGPGSTTNATFTVSLSSPSDDPVAVSYATAPGTASEGSDYGRVSGRLTFAPLATSRTVTVPVNGDAAVEPNETFAVVLSAPSGADLADDRGAGTITNDDAPAAPAAPEQPQFVADAPPEPDTVGNTVIGYWKVPGSRTSAVFHVTQVDALGGQVPPAQWGWTPDKRGAIFRPAGCHRQVGRVDWIIGFAGGGAFRRYESGTKCKSWDIYTTRWFLNGPNGLRQNYLTNLQGIRNPSGRQVTLFWERVRPLLDLQKPSYAVSAKRFRIPFRTWAHHDHRITLQRSGRRIQTTTTPVRDGKWIVKIRAPLREAKYKVILKARRGDDLVTQTFPFKLTEKGKVRPL